MDDEPDRIDWLTDMDKQILEVLSSELILTPAIIAENIGRSRKGVSNRINSLQAGELIEKIDRGKYRITDEGRSVLESFNKEKIRGIRLDITQRRLIEEDLGVTREEYLRQARKEYEQIRKDEDIEEPFEEAFERVESRLREDAEEESN
ncbi:winged helix-turn-helix domain-containing protein [Halosimplex litoreum]|uniref:Winged helix-turn-helix domain-containing protein n=1 Tax=Halosimplex litoreum TaxID=1198301 RepID=A0A7T3KVN6_9EURY|nr:winged helix-turn-helix domain-containing protein [Halosimplex litoreum]QPV63178.1 winged helix-turn-helix domain-containing protein [Halosimplex litoreum]